MNINEHRLEEELKKYRSCLSHFCMLTPIQYQWCIRECLWVVVNLKRRY